MQVQQLQKRYRAQKRAKKFVPHSPPPLPSKIKWTFLRGMARLTYAPINVIPGWRGADGGGDFDKAFIPEGVAFDFMDSPLGADI